eukprot:NODE_116_length_19003_cov_0.233707.p3 type:complete len:531 gc:universal NODE_116_length_19003_cov_0.233707:16928-18520(+)
MLLWLISLAMNNSEDCSSLIALATSMNMNSSAPIFQHLFNDCCYAPGVICLSGRVTELHWQQLSLSGYINGTSLPKSLTYLNLDDNQISSSIPYDLPSGLTFLSLKGNKLEGLIPYVLPSNLTTLRLGYNDLNGYIHSLPGGLVHLELNNNNLFGSIPTILPQELTHLDLSSNNLQSNVPQNLPFTLKYLSLHTNRLTGTFYSMLYGITYLDLHRNQLSGTLTAYFLQFLNIRDNQFTDVNVIQKFSLTPLTCDLSNNPLDMTNPHIASLTMCIISQRSDSDSSTMVETDTILSSSVVNEQSTNVFTSFTIDADKKSMVSKHNLVQDSDSFTASTATFPKSKSVEESLSYPNSSRTEELISFALSSASSSSVSKYSTKKEDENKGTSKQAEYLSFEEIEWHSTAKSSKTSKNESKNTDEIKSINYRTVFKSSLMSTVDWNSAYASMSYDDYTATVPDVDAAKRVSTIQELLNSPNILYIAAGGLLAAILLVFVAAKVFKHPKMNSKFGRKNSYGTLNTVASRRTAKKTIF